MSEFGQRLIEETRRVAAAQSDYLYNGECKYVEYGQPGCLIGHALWSLGLIDESFEYVHANALDVLGLFDELSTTVDDVERDWLAAAQSAQDSDMPWGRAVSFADSEIEMLQDA